MGRGKTSTQRNEPEFPSDRHELSQFGPAIKMCQRDAAALTAELADYERVRRVALLPEGV